jgi:hypothetical protein
LIRRTAFALSSSVKNQAFVGESGNRKLQIHEWKKKRRKVWGSHKNANATMRVSDPVIIISLEESKYMGEMLNLFLPLPWLKYSGVYVQGPIADETRDNLT